jgi:hypothetical protein
VGVVVAAYDPREIVRKTLLCVQARHPRHRSKKEDLRTEKTSTLSYG